jgi:hypothetical protein
MAVTVLTATALVANTVSASLPVTGFTAIDASKTMQVLYPREGKLVLILNNTFAGSKVFTIEAGEYLSNGIGDYAITMGQDEVRFLVIDSTRFKDFDGLVSITFAGSTTGFVGALSLPY